MTQAETIPNTTRRSFISGVADNITVTPVVADEPDTEIITAGRKFEELFSRYMPVWSEWTRLHREARSETEAKFGDDYGSPAWREPNPGQSPAEKFFRIAYVRNGADRAYDEEEALHQQMEPIALLIRDGEIRSVAGLRAKALVAIWDSRPTCADHNGCIELDDEWSLHSLLTGVVAVTGLSDLFGAFVERIEADATLPLDA